MIQNMQLIANQGFKQNSSDRDTVHPVERRCAINIEAVILREKVT